MSDKPYKVKPGTFPEKSTIDEECILTDDWVRRWYDEVSEKMLYRIEAEKERMSKDLISREAAVSLIREKADGYKASHFVSSHEHIKVREMTLDCAVKIENLPAVDAEPVRHGYWIAKTHIDGEVTHECSYCGEEAINYDDHYGGITSEPTDYCPYCGTKMDLGDIG